MSINSQRRFEKVSFEATPENFVRASTSITPCVKELTHSRSLLLLWHMLAYLLTNFIANLVYSFCSDFKIQNLFSNIQLRIDL